MHLGAILRHRCLIYRRGLDVGLSPEEADKGNYNQPAHDHENYHRWNRSDCEFKHQFDHRPDRHLNIGYDHRHRLIGLVRMLGIGKLHPALRAAVGSFDDLDTAPWAKV